MKNKYNVIVNGMAYNDVYIINNISEYSVYTEELNNAFTVAEQEIRTIKSFMGHGHSLLTGLAGFLCGMIDNIDERQPMLDHLIYLKASMLSGQLKHILDGNKLIINAKFGYFSVKPSDSIEVLNINANEYTEANIKTIKWPGGRHYYAKIGRVDVIDEDGNVKWNTEQYARSMAIKFLHKLNGRID